LKLAVVWFGENNNRMKNITKHRLSSQ